MQRSPIRLSLLIDAHEEKRTAGGSPKSAFEGRKVGFAAIKVVVEIHEKGGDALTVARDVVGQSRDLWVQEVVMWSELLPLRVV